MNTCNVDGCDRAVRAKQMCGVHRRRLLAGKPLNRPIRTRVMHGLSKSHPLYKTWQGMRSRCGVVSDGQYKHYGARGIKVCERWNDFSKFVEDVGEKPTPKHQLDRIDNNGNYEPTNVRWVLPRQQLFNQRISKRNKSGYRNIFWEERRGKWLVNIAVNRKTIFVGRYEILEDAIAAQKGALDKYGKDFIPVPD